MSLKEVKKSLTDEDITRFMAHLGSTRINNMKPNELVFQTICHHKRNEHMKHKLYYYKNSRKFFCYSSCANIGDIFNLVEQVLGLDKKESVKYVLKFFDINMSLQFFEEEDYGFGFEEEDEEDTTYHSLKLEDMEVESLPPIKRQSIMRTFIKYYCREWVEEGISKETMDKYDIRFSLEKTGIIIPHHNIKGEIVGIRVRNLDKYSIEHFGKYTPLCIGGKMFNHKLSGNLYGLDKNKEAIKKFKKVVVFEGEKSVLLMDSIYKDNSIAVAVCGSSMSRIQMKMLVDLGVEEVIFAYDKQYSEVSSESVWRKKIERLAKPMIEYGIECSRIWDSLEGGQLEHKDSPIDNGVKVYKELVKNRVKITIEEEKIG